MYSDLENQSQVYELTIKLGEIRQGEDFVTKYFNSLKRLWQDLDFFNDYEWKSTEDASHNKKITEAHRIYKFLVGLNVEFDEVRGRINSKSSLPPIGEVFDEVRREESRRHARLGKRNTGGPVEGFALTGTAAEATANKATNFQRKPEEKSWVWCDYCNKSCHTRKTCWKIHGKPANWRSSKSGDRDNCSIPTANEAETSPFSKEQMDHLLKLLKSNSKPGIPSVSLAQTELRCTCHHM